MKNIFLISYLLISTLFLSEANGQKLASGDHHYLVIKADGTLWAWGFNGYGQLGDGTTIDKTIPIQIGTANDWESVATSPYHTIAIKKNGTLWAWGANSRGQLGDGTNIRKTTPIQIGTDTDWKEIVAKEGHNLALRADGTLWVWGYNNNGQLGDGTTIDKNVPTKITLDSDWKTIAAGSSFSLAIKTNGSLWAWGGIDKIPTVIGTTNDWLNITAGQNHKLALKTDGSLWAWGDNYFGQLGDGTTVSKISPTQIGTAKDWKYIVAGKNHTVAIKNNGTLWTWGGLIVQNTESITPIQTQIGTEVDWRATLGGWAQSLAVKTDGRVYTWGNNTWGQIGNGIIGNSYDTPQNINFNIGINPPTGNTTQSFCSGATVASLTVTGTNIKWYTASTGGTALTNTVTLSNSTIYYASQTVNGVESTERLAVTVNLAKVSTIASLTNVALGSNASLTGSITGATSYQWQSNINDIGWINLPNNSTYSGSNTNRLTVNNIRVSNHMQEFRLIATTATCRDTSNVATISVLYTLPVELTSFDATISKQSEVILNWKTSSELNNSYFTIAKSSDGKNFTDLTRVASQGERGDYRAMDENPFSGITYYKLSQTDKDGTTKELGIKAVKTIILTESNINVYPNPVINGIINIQHSELNGVQEIVIYDLSGKRLITDKVNFMNGTATYQIKAVLEKGIYLLNIGYSQLNSRIMVE